MQSVTPPVRTHHAFADQQSLQELLGERLRQSPWLVLSAAVHAVLLLLIWALFPAKAEREATATVQMQFDEKQQVVEPPPPPPPETQPEVVVDDVVVEPQPVSENQSNQDSSFDQPASVESAHEFNQWNTATGMGGGAAGPYSQRGGGGGGRGTGRATPPSVQYGLEWLARHQDDDGRWDADRFMKHDDPKASICGGPGNPVHDIGVTGLALLAFLGENNTMRSGPYRDVVKRGVLWLKEQQDPESGRFGGATSSDFVYDHAIAAYAMCEAYGLSQYRLLRPVAQAGISYLESHRNPYAVWRYQPRDDDNDISVTAWAVMAYESGHYFGLDINKAALDNAEVFLDQVSDQSGLHGYRNAGESSSRKRGDHGVRFPAEKTHALTAVGLFARCFLHQDPKEQPVMDAAADLLLQRPPTWNEHDGSIDHYYWYYGTYALFQMGGPRWTRWQKALTRAVVDHQHTDRKESNLFGSWDPVGAWGDDGGRVYSTAILTLTMQAGYRYTRLLR